MLRRSLFMCTRNYANQAAIQKKQSPLMKRIINEFDNYVPKVIDESLAKVTFSPEVKDRIKKASEYYTVGRNPVQGEFMLLAFESMNQDLKITDELIHQLEVVVATVEMVQSYFFFWDDLEDEAKTRLNKPCWHLIDNIGMMAFNDACILRTFIDEVVRQNFNLEMRDKILNVYHQVYFNASVGQHLDAEIARSKNFDNYTIEKYNTINTWKSSFYAIKSPLLLALTLSKKLNNESIDIVENIAFDIGILIQCHNDLIDYFNTKGKVTGKTGSDIQMGKCSWVAAAVLENCSAAQRRIFTENYGSSDPEKVNRILQLYEEVDVENLYKQEEQKRFALFNKKVTELPKNSALSAEFYKTFYNLVNYYTQDVLTLMYDKY
ncbi:PREDICTED: farnesyl pyrophosphate synthase-like [Papilio xuthus]|uniref:Farnesyl pyrophosphate synthase-like n=1 Tax=Papilio xuthus TaxID=66420 RepID=A0AAJ6Z0G2_PAPXU|nr:PREDICTED: farnesyl pyrophosphate synthase-like [Papilio xuthus]